MIKGRGLLANALRRIDTEPYLFYVNGLSNSVIEEVPGNSLEQKEVEEIAKNIGDKTFVYFSTIQVNAHENFSRPYVCHKLDMEGLIKDLFPAYRIIRTSNLVGNNPWNPHTLFNYLYRALIAGTEIEVMESVSRNMIDVDDFITVFEYYLTTAYRKNEVIQIVNPVSYNMAEILRTFETLFSRRFIIKNSEDHFAHFQAPVNFSLTLFKKCNIDLENYLARVISKYYCPDSYSSCLTKCI